MFETPVLFLVFNRLDTTKQVFAKIREIQPRQLFVGADGARVGKEGEAEKVTAVRKYILDNIDWDCEVKTLFREQNLGCGKAVSEAITWFFDNVEQGIILEDDTLPDLSFFRFCEELLNYYKDDEKVMHIGGSNFQNGKRHGTASYYFSKYIHIWGWATWRSAWAKYKFQMDFNYIQYLDTYIKLPKKENEYWQKVYSEVAEGKIDTWDVQWAYSCWINDGLSVTPNINLIENVGFGVDATHTVQNNNLIIKNNKPLKIENTIYTSTIKLCYKADRYVFKNIFDTKVDFINKLRNISYKYFPNLYNFLKKAIKR